MQNSFVSLVNKEIRVSIAVLYALFRFFSNQNLQMSSNNGFFYKAFLELGKCKSLIIKYKKIHSFAD